MSIRKAEIMMEKWNTNKNKKNKKIIFALLIIIIVLQCFSISYSIMLDRANESSLASLEKEYTQINEATYQIEPTDSVWVLHGETSQVVCLILKLKSDMDVDDRLVTLSDEKNNSIQSFSDNAGYVVFVLNNLEDNNYRAYDVESTLSMNIEWDNYTANYPLDEMIIYYSHSFVGAALEIRE